jgi:hypothetical protein
MLLNVLLPFFFLPPSTGVGFLQPDVRCRLCGGVPVGVGGLGILCTVCVLLLQDLLQSCARGGRRRVEDMCYERRRAEACVDESAQHALVNAGGREIV